jgi:hypothetical protein
MKQRFLSLALTMFSLLWGQQVVAYDFEVNGIYYNLNSSYLTATVTFGDTPYKGMVIIPDSVIYKGKTLAVKLVGESAFANCSDLTAVQFGKNIGTIDDYAFKNCIKLTHLVIPSTISRIETGAFYGCSNLKELTFEDCVNYIGIGTNGSEKLSSAFDCKPEYLYMGRQLGYNSNYYNLDNSNLKTLIIGNQVKSISGFSGAQITSLSIPSSITTIGENAFNNCKKLETVLFEDGLATVTCYKSYSNGDYHSTFYECPLKELYLGRPIKPSDGYTIYEPFNYSSVSMITISNSLSSLCAFYGCLELKEIDIPASIEKIRSFGGCSSILSVKCRATTPPRMDLDYLTFFDNNTLLNGVLYVPSSSIDIYKADKNWGKFFDIQPLNEEGQYSPAKCKKPIINYDNKRISFSSNTPNVIFHHTITSPDIITGVNDGEILLSALYRISVYASRAGYDDSDETIAYLYWTEANLESSDIQTVRANARGLLIQSSDGFITISGLDNNETVSMYTVEGCLIENSKSISGTAIFNVGRTDKAVIIKIGNESIKIAL